MLCAVFTGSHSLSSMGQGLHAEVMAPQIWLSVDVVQQSLHRTAVVLLLCPRSPESKGKKHGELLHEFKVPSYWWSRKGLPPVYPLTVGHGAGLGPLVAPRFGALAHCSLAMDGQCLAVPYSPQSRSTQEYWIHFVLCTPVCLDL